MIRVHQIAGEGTDGVAVTDGDYIVRVVDGVVDGLVSVADPASALLSLTTAINGVPELVWDDNDEIVLTEVPL